MPADLGPGPGASKLLDEVRRALRLRHYSRRTEEAYVRWIRRFVRFHGVRHPAELTAAEVSHFLSNLATDAGVSAATQNQALSALLFLYREVLGRDLGWVSGVVRAKDALRLPVVLTRAEVRAVLGRMAGVPRVVGALLYGSGLRLLEGLQLRVKDVDFGAREIRVRGGKGNRDRVTMLPDRLVAPLRAHLERVRRQHEADVAEGAGWVALPGALDRKYVNAGREWVWQ